MNPSTATIPHACGHGFDLSLTNDVVRALVDDIREWAAGRVCNVCLLEQVAAEQANAGQATAGQAA